ncbi:hypothetical protein BGZ61DRAFT_524626 [Ilyonectria robusta]|uniref:uncharacterized protein n=1 Tax=Ilyonectria robusta TaxID=1079257 RepID=UPI001E8CB0F1|nr:uncharacterized protein BGZ61DRAFT_524626 [Ilyonectria robusta]KAH8650720.1 hypothetical protein BGZ61DRAFT_524626 [Ilyonectria robusta]
MASKDPTCHPPSVNSMRDSHPRERLLTHPLLWTDRQLQAFDCRFINDANDTPHPKGVQFTPSRLPLTPPSSAPKPHLCSQDEPTEEARRLARSCHPPLKYYALACLLRSQGFEKTGDSIAFYHNGRPAYRPKCSVFSPKHDGGLETSRPLQLAHLDYAEILGSRRKMLMPSRPPQGSDNAPGRAIFHKKLAKVTPKDWSQDPFLVSILISLAQSQQHHVGTSQLGHDALSSEDSYTAQLLLTHNLDRHAIHLYESEIPTMFLSKLTDPHHHGMASMAVHHKIVPFEPHNDLSERLAALLR